MSELAVVNASPLICLARAGLGHLLRHAAESVVVPLSVSREILARGAHDVTAAFVASTSWLNQVDDPKIPDGILAWDLGAGESAVLAYALDRVGERAIIDDLQARRMRRSSRHPSSRHRGAHSASASVGADRERRSIACDRQAFISQIGSFPGCCGKSANSRTAARPRDVIWCSGARSLHTSYGAENGSSVINRSGFGAVVRCKK